MNVQIAIEEASQVGQARREAVALARRMSLDASAADRLGLAVTEAATNVVKHGAGGRLLLAQLTRNEVLGVEVIALDRGPGIANVAASMRDGHSTAGSLGVGLGSISRVASNLDIYSRTGGGTVMRFEVWVQDPPPPASFGGICVARRGEAVAGDAWSLDASDGRYRMLLVDGLGHGIEAAAAAREALRAADRSPALAPARLRGHGCRRTLAPDQLLDDIHGALRATRGAAAAVAIVTPHASAGAYAGIGNISAVVVAADTRSLVSHNGTLGHQVRKIQPFDFLFPARALLIMHSDGVSSRWRLDDYPGLARHHPAVIAAALYRDHGRPHDDATVAVLRNDVRRTA